MISVLCFILALASVGMSMLLMLLDYPEPGRGMMAASLILNVLGYFALFNGV